MTIWPVKSIKWDRYQSKLTLHPNLNIHEPANDGSSQVNETHGYFLKDAEINTREGISKNNTLESIVSLYMEEEQISADCFLDQQLGTDCTDRGSRIETDEMGHGVNGAGSDQLECLADSADCEEIMIKGRDESQDGCAVLGNNDPKMDISSSLYTSSSGCSRSAFSSISLRLNGIEGSFSRGTDLNKSQSDIKEEDESSNEQTSLLSSDGFPSKCAHMASTSLFVEIFEPEVSEPLKEPTTPNPSKPSVLVDPRDTIRLVQELVVKRSVISTNAMTSTDTVMAPEVSKCQITNVPVDVPYSAHPFYKKRRLRFKEIAPTDTTTTTSSQTQATSSLSISSLKETFKELSSIFANTKLCVSVSKPGPHFVNNAFVSSISNPQTCNKLERLEHREHEGNHWILESNGITDVPDGVDSKVLMVEYIQVKLPEGLIQDGEKVKDAGNTLIRRVLKRFGRLDKRGSFKYKGCWRFEEFKPVLVIPAILPANDKIFVKCKGLKDYGTVHQLLLDKDYRIEFQNIIASQRSCIKTGVKSNDEVLDGIDLSRQGFYDELYQDQYEIERIEAEVNETFIKFIDLVISTYYEHFLEVSKVRLDYVMMYESYMRTKPVDLGYLFLSLLNIPFTDSNTEKETSIDYIHEVFRGDANLKIAYVLLMLCYLQSAELHGFILRSLLFRVDLEEQEAVDDRWGVIPKIKRWISSSSVE